MSVVVVTGSAGLIGSETVAFYAELGLDVVGIDNDMRRVFFGEAASTAWNREPEPNGTGRLLGCPKYDDALFTAIEAFKDEHRSRGPEPVP